MQKIAAAHIKRQSRDSGERDKKCKKKQQQIDKKCKKKQQQMDKKCKKNKKKSGDIKKNNSSAYQKTEQREIKNVKKTAADR